MGTEATPPLSSGRIPRRHDLDALRAIAMLLGIVLHAGLSFTTTWWIVRDTRQHIAFDVAFAAIHGFRMPLFFLISGFFTAMLWRKRGLKRLIHHRFMRIFLPMIICLVTIVPLVIGMSIGAMATAGGAGPSADWVGAVRGGDVALLEAQLAQGMDAQTADPATGMTPLMYASLMGHTDMVERLLEAGAKINARNRDGNTALHSAAFLGRVDTVQHLLEHGADPTIKANDAARPLESARAPWELTQWILGLLQLEEDRDAVETGRRIVIPLLEGREKGGFDAKVFAEAGADKAGKPKGKAGTGAGSWERLSQGSVWAHLWFLWFLCWLVAGFAVYALVMDRLGVECFPRWLILAPGCLLWILPLTLVVQLHMREGGFGPDTSAGFLPKRHVLLYYGIFFMFGAFYFDVKDEAGRLGRWWKPTLLVTLLVVFPVGLDLQRRFFGITFLERLPEDAWQRGTALFQVLYTWGMCFGLMGLFRALYSKENKAMRYISDSSYWLYIAHLPLVLAGQWLIRSWNLPPVVKFVLLTGLISAFLLWTYETLIRYTFVGTLLNGPRKRAVPAPPGMPPLPGS